MCFWRMCVSFTCKQASLLSHKNHFIHYLWFTIFLPEFWIKKKVKMFMWTEEIQPFHGKLKVKAFVFACRNKKKTGNDNMWRHLQPVYWFYRPDIIIKARPSNSNFLRGHEARPSIRKLGRVSESSAEFYNTRPSLVTAHPHIGYAVTWHDGRISHGNLQCV